MFMSYVSDVIGT